MTGIVKGNVVNDLRDSLFAGSGEMAVRCRAFDWASTSLGPVDQWPQSLRTAAQLTLSSIFATIVLWGPELIQIYNEGYRPILGVKHPIGLGQPTHACWPEVRHINQPIYDRVFQGETLTFEDARYPLSRFGVLEDGWFTLVFAPIRDETGTIAGVFVTVQETTATLKARALEAEREMLTRQLSVERNRLAEIFRLAPSFLVVMRGPEHVFELANDAFYAIIGHRDIIGKLAGDVLPEAREQGLIDLLDGVLSTGEPFVGRELSFAFARTPGGVPEQHYIDFVYQALIEADGTRSGIVAHGSDVTEQVVARQEVERLLAETEAARAETELARQRADDANRAKSEFLAVMSHELRTPLNAIGGYAELLEIGIHGPISPEQRTALERIQRSQRHLLDLINGVLNYAKIDAGAVVYKLADVSLDEALATCEALTSPQIREKALAFHYAGRDLALAVRADREKLQQIVLNLLSNAIKFTEPNGRVTVECADTGDGHIVVRVSDTGGGIAVDQLERVFQPFVQVDTKLTRTKEGTGLGLAISRDLARGMGGDLTVESEPGIGSTFTLSLPAAGSRNALGRLRDAD